MNAHVAAALAVLSIFGIVLGACGGSSVYPTTYKVLPCGNAMSVDHQAHAYAAMLLSLQERQWTFQHQNKKKHSILARNCIANSSNAHAERRSRHRRRHRRPAQPDRHPGRPGGGTGG